MHATLRSGAVAAVLAASFSATFVAAVNEKAALAPRFALAYSDSGCNAQEMMNACLGNLQNRANSCGDNDYGCMCAAYESLATCYNNCPDDEARMVNQAQVDSYCGMARAQTSTDYMMSETMSPEESMTDGAYDGEETMTNSSMYDMDDMEDGDDMEDMDDMETMTEMMTETMTDMMTEMMTETMTDEMTMTATETGLMSTDGAVLPVTIPTTGLLAVLLAVIGMW